MRLLHLFAGPFPTVQGTQALVGQTCRLLARAGHEVHLLCYAHAGPGPAEPFAIHRIPDLPRFRDERSGPKWQKPLLDASLAAACRRLLAEISPDAVHAHHYEALAAARSSDPRRRTPLVFQLHALLGPELGSYGPRILAGAAGATGAWVDRWLPRLADRVVVLDSRTADHIAAIAPDSPPARVASPPFDVPGPARDRTPPEPGPDGRLRAVYSGNLDRYQGIGALLSALELLPPDARDLLAVEIVTASDAARLLEEIERRSLGDLVSVIEHGDLSEAWPRTAGAGIALVPRSAPGGVPIKLVNALAAGRPVLADREVAADLVNGEEAWLVDASDPAQMAAGLERLARDPALRRRLSTGAIRAAGRLYHPRRYVEALEEVYADLVSDAARG